jgi:hypothetical protein
LVVRVDTRTAGAREAGIIVPGTPPCCEGAGCGEGDAGTGAANTGGAGMGDATAVYLATEDGESWDTEAGGRSSA